LTKTPPGKTEKMKRYASLAELFVAYGHGDTRTHRPVQVRMEPRRLVKPAQSSAPVAVGDDGKLPDGDKRIYMITTIGRAIFNDILPPGMPFYNYELNKKSVQDLISDCHRLLGRDATLKLLDDLKDLGFKAATRAGMSFAKDDIRIPPGKGRILLETQKEIDKIEKAFQKGVITEGERYLKIVDLWTHARERVGEDLMRVLQTTSTKRPATSTRSTAW
jgi:DNA-directed RNA polymerase subunit beta'